MYIYIYIYIYNIKCIFYEILSHEKKPNINIYDNSF